MGYVDDVKGTVRAVLTGDQHTNRQGFRRVPQETEDGAEEYAMDPSSRWSSGAGKGSFESSVPRRRLIRFGLLSLLLLIIGWPLSRLGIPELSIGGPQYERPPGFGHVACESYGMSLGRSQIIDLSRPTAEEMPGNVPDGNGLTIRVFGQARGFINVIPPNEQVLDPPTRDEDYEEEYNAFNENDDTIKRETDQGTERRHIAVVNSRLGGRADFLGRAHSTYGEGVWELVVPMSGQEDEGEGLTSEDIALSSCLAYEVDVSIPWDIEYLRIETEATSHIGLDQYLTQARLEGDTPVELRTLEIVQHGNGTNMVVMPKVLSMSERQEPSATHGASLDSFVLDTNRGFVWGSIRVSRAVEVSSRDAEIDMSLDLIESRYLPGDRIDVYDKTTINTKAEGGSSHYSVVKTSPDLSVDAAHFDTGNGTDVGATVEAFYSGFTGSYSVMVDESVGGQVELGAQLEMQATRADDGSVSGMVAEGKDTLRVGVKGADGRAILDVY